MRRWERVLVAMALVGSGCTTVERGEDFNVAEVVFDEAFYYCSVEPMLFAQSCGSGAMGDPSGGCHFNVTTFKLTDYMPLVGQACQNGRPASAVPAAAQNNYSVANVKMRADVENAPLLTRPTGQHKHPRVIFQANSPEADIIRAWSKLYTTQ